MYSSITRPRQLSRLACLCRYTTSVEGQKLPQTSNISDGISPPARIPRGSTDILEALAATVGPDPTAAHYKYHDDPYLIPLSNYRKRAYALSAEAGRRAAVWIRDNHAELFTTRQWDPPTKKITPYFNADPQIDAYAPKPIYTSESKVTEDDLKYTINNALIEDSIQVFSLLGGSDNLSDELKSKFLQLLCFYNEKEADSLEWSEERWFAANVRDRQATTWKVGGLAEKIFTSMEPKTSDAYCAIIQGMAKFYQAERAHVLAQEAIEKGFTLSTDVFNSLLGCVGFLKEGTSLRIEALKATLTQMNDLGIRPNQQTLSSCLRSVSSWGGGRILQFAAQILQEFKVLGIKPGLSAYYFLLCLYCKERGPRVDILSSILNDLETRDNLNATEQTDTHFFITAMGISSDHLQSVEMAERVHALLMKGDNYNLVGDAYKESIYYRHFVTVACRHAPYERTKELLDTLVPNVYVPEPSVMEEIMKTVELAGDGDRLVQTWSELVIFGHANRMKLVERMLEAMCNCYQYQTDEIKAKTRAAAADVLKFGHPLDGEQPNDKRSPPPRLPATALSNIAWLCSDVKDPTDVHWESVSDCVSRLNRDEATGVGQADILTEVASRAANIGKHGIAATTITYMTAMGFDQASTNCVSILSTILNRSEEEVQTLLQEPRAKVVDNLHPAAVVIFDAYNNFVSGGNIVKDSDSTSSDSDSSSDDE